MSNDAAGYVSASLGQFLVSVADGLAHAQQALTDARTLDERGRPGPSYHIPRLDFEVRVAAAMSLTETSSTLPARTAAKGEHELFVDVATVQQSSVSAFSTEALSTLKGSVVAVPPNAGAAAPVVQTSVSTVDPATYELSVIIRDAAGSPLEAVEVHVNPHDPGDAPGITQGLLLTDSSGRASTTLTVPPGSKKAVVIDTVDLTEVVLVGGAS